MSLKPAIFIAAAAACALYGQKPEVLILAPTNVTVRVVYTNAPAPPTNQPPVTCKDTRSYFLHSSGGVDDPWVRVYWRDGKTGRRELVRRYHLGETNEVKPTAIIPRFDTNFLSGLNISPGGWWRILNDQ